MQIGPQSSKICSSFTSQAAQNPSKSVIANESKSRSAKLAQVRNCLQDSWCIDVSCPLPIVLLWYRFIIAFFGVPLSHCLFYSVVSVSICVQPSNRLPAYGLPNRPQLDYWCLVGDRTCFLLHPHKIIWQATKRSTYQVTSCARQCHAVAKSPSLLSSFSPPIMHHHLPGIRRTSSTRLRFSFPGIPQNNAPMTSHKKAITPAPL